MKCLLQLLQEIQSAAEKTLNSIEDLKKNESVNKLNKNIKKLALIILSNNPIHLEKYSEKSKFESIISGIDQSNLNVRLNEILKLV